MGRQSVEFFLRESSLINIETKKFFEEKEMPYL